MFETVDRYFLFADVKGYSKLKGKEYLHFAENVLPVMAAAIEKFEPEHRNTWGDAIFAVFQNSHNAARCAFKLCEDFHTAAWSNNGFNDRLMVRIALHFGQCHKCRNPITGNPEYLGNSINLTARIEPIVGPNQVWATDAFVQALRQAAFEPTLHEQDLGERDLFKGAGRMRLWRISRYTFDFAEAVKDDFYQNLDYLVHGVQHINLPVADLTKSVRFYSDIMKLKLLPQAYDLKNEKLIRAYCENYGFELLEKPITPESLKQLRCRLPFEFPGAWFDLPSKQQLHLIPYDPSVDTRQPAFRNRAEDKQFGKMNFKDVHIALSARDYHEMMKLHEKAGVKPELGPMGDQYYLTDPDHHIIEITGMDGPTLNPPV